MNQLQRDLFLFVGFLAANTLLSYFHLSIESKLWIGCLGLLIPAALWLKANKAKTHDLKLMDQLEFLPSIPFWMWVLVAVLALTARFFHLTTLFVWPNFDESSYGFDAFHLASGWTPRFFYGVSQAPPFFIWGLALFFKVFGASLSSLWAFPALVSLATVPLSYWAARTFFSKSFSFLCATLTGLSFWPVFVGRFALMTILILPAEYLALFLLGRFLTTATFSARLKIAALLGLAWGLGFYTHLHWPVVVTLTFLPFAVGTWARKNKNFSQTWAPVFWALGATFLVVLPLFLAAFREHYGGYLTHLWAFKKDFSLSKQVTIWLSCLTSPFWGIDPDVHTYQPVWGGFLNPVLSSLFFLGTIHMIRQWKRPLYLWTLGGLFLCLLPGLLTQDQETFRLFPMVPLLILGILVGLGTLMNPSAPRRNFLWVLALAIPSMGLDFYHLFGAYHQIWDDPSTWGSYTKSVARYRAYGILREWRDKEGTGLIFPDFVQGLPDQSLSLATYDYNAILNPRLNPAQARWAAVLANVNYQPFLKKRFPDGVAYGLSKDFKEPDGGWMLFILPLDAQRLNVLESWRRAQSATEEFIDRNLCYVMGQSFEEDLSFLSNLEPTFQGDPFLQAAFLEKKSDLEIKEGLMRFQSGEPFPSAQDPAIQSLEKATQDGYPAAHLYEHLGILWLMHENTVQAQKCFEEATQAPLNLTDASQYLDSLKQPAERTAVP